MSDRIKGFMVVLDENVKDEDAIDTLNAIRQIKRVACVEPVLAKIDDEMVEWRLRYDLGTKLAKLIIPDRFMKRPGE